MTGHARCDTGGDALRMLVVQQRRPPLAERDGAVAWSDGLAPRRDGISGGDVRRTPSPNWPSDASCIVGASGSGCTGRWRRDATQTWFSPSSGWPSGSTDASGMGTRLIPGLPSRGLTLNCGHVRSRPTGSEICGPVTSPGNLAGTLIGCGSATSSETLRQWSTSSRRRQQPFERPRVDHRRQNPQVVSEPHRVPSRHGQE